jgi:hypothetical protein
MTLAYTLIRRAIEELWNAEQLDVADELFASDYVNHGGLITDLIRGPEAVKTTVVFFRRAFPNLSIRINLLETTDGMAVLHWSASNRSASAQAGSDHTDDVRDLAGLMRIRIAGGKVVESWTEWDHEEALRRLVPLDAMDRASPVSEQALDRWEDEGGSPLLVCGNDSTTLPGR